MPLPSGDLPWTLLCIRFLSQLSPLQHSSWLSLNNYLNNFFLYCVFLTRCKPMEQVPLAHHWILRIVTAPGTHLLLNKLRCRAFPGDSAVTMTQALPSRSSQSGGDSLTESSYNRVWLSAVIYDTGSSNTANFCLWRHNSWRDFISQVLFEQGWGRHKCHYR